MPWGWGANGLPQAQPHSRAEVSVLEGLFLRAWAGAEPSPRAFASSRAQAGAVLSSGPLQQALPALRFQGSGELALRLPHRGATVVPSPDGARALAADHLPLLRKVDPLCCQFLQLV